MEWWRQRKHDGGESVNDLRQIACCFFWTVTGADKLTTGGADVNRVVATA